ncbi:MAG: dihydropteroate synthase [Solirubrobacteraceae bacterium]|nr:dihydropteroate synthase [Solirubrobacteraceae bacterium]
MDAPAVRLEVQLPCVMGILNVTPDSFSDGGRFTQLEAAVAQGIAMARDGAAIIDVGGESTRPGSDRVSLDEELARVLPVIERLRAETSAVVSIDTYKAEVARQALAAGAALVNDVSALRMDPAMVEVVAETGAPAILMHMQGEPKTMQQDPHYDDVVDDVRAFLEERMGFALARGVDEEQLLIDPGIGFGKTVAHNLVLLRGLARLKELGRPLVLGASRKRFLGAILGAEPGGRLIGTVASTVIGLMNGADVVRVHDVRENFEALRVVLALREADDEAGPGSGR